jgi:hypothetical protein
MTMLLSRIFLKLHILHDRRLHVDELICIPVYSGFRCCPSLLDITGCPVFLHNFRNSSLFTATCKNSPCARCVSAANRVCKDVDICRKPIISLKQILRYDIFKLTYLFFSGFRIFAPIFRLFCFFPTAFFVLPV